MRIHDKENNMDQFATETEPRKIHFKFHPFDIERKGHFLEKAEGGVKRRYLRGISSGIMIDGHGERMTMKAIEGMHEQGRSGTILLYAGLHGVNFIDDLGRLTNSDIVNGQDWLTEYRLYDELDGLDNVTTGRADKLWKQIAGINPYVKPIQKGFSIEGIVPEESILDKEVLPNGEYARRTIDKVLMDGTLVVNRPAYEDSVVTAVYKCLGELPPAAVQRAHEKLHKSMFNKLSELQDKDNYYQKLFRLNNALEENITEIMERDDPRNRERLDILLEEYKGLLINLIFSNQGVFQPEPDAEGGVEAQVQVMAGDKAELLMKELASISAKLSTALTKRIGRT